MGSDARRGLAVVISGPSGAGKTTVARLLAQRFGYELSVSATTRAPRAGEQEGREYRFMTREAFTRALEQGDFLEHSEHFDSLYGTPRGPVERALDQGRVILLQIDVNGARQVMEKLPGAYCIFLSALDMGTVEGRLRGRRTESEASIRTRLQRAEMEMAAGLKYDARVVNDDLERTVSEIHSLIRQQEERQGNGCGPS